MLNRDILILHMLRLLFGGVEGAVQLRGDVYPVHLPAAAHSGQAVYLLFKGGGKGLPVLAHAGDKLGDKLLLKQSRHKMLLIHLRAALLYGDALGLLHSGDGFLSKLVYVHYVFSSFFEVIIHD